MVHMDEGYMNVFMGHRTSISGRYLEKPTQVLELEYCKVEPTVTVFEASETSSISEVRTELSERKAEILDLRNENLELRNRMARMELSHTKLEKHIESLESTVKRIHRTLEQIGKSN